MTNRASSFVVAVCTAFAIGCGPNWRDLEAAAVDRFHARVQQIPETCLNREVLVASFHALPAFLAAAPQALESWTTLTKALRTLYDIPSVRCAIDLALGWTDRDAMRAVTDPTRRINPDKVLTRDAALLWLRRNPETWEATPGG